MKAALLRKNLRSNKTKLSHVANGDKINASYEISTLIRTQKDKVWPIFFDKMKNIIKRKKVLKTLESND